MARRETTFRLPVYYLRCILNLIRWHFLIFEQSINIRKLLQPTWKCRNKIWATKKARTLSSAKRTINVKMVMYAVVSKSRKETVQVEIPHLKTVDGKCTNGYLWKTSKSIRLRIAVGLFCKIRIILHDNAPTHTSKEADTFLENTGLTIFQHPYYSLDLAPCYFFLFPRLKKTFMDRRYH